MIDIKKAKQAFKEYVKNYDTENGKIKLKIAHTYRVSEISKKIAEELRLDKEDIELAELIGLLHDIGRFEQIKKYGTFEDAKSVNHAELAVKILFEENWIRNFIKDNKYDSIIYKAILNHNKLRIEEGLNEKELLHSKIIRDADKTDIFYVLTTDTIDNAYGCSKEHMSKEEITDEIVREFMEDKAIDYTKRKTDADKIVSQFVFVYDFNFDYGLKVIYDNNYLEKMTKIVEFEKEETRNKIEKIYKKAKEYIEERLGVNNG